MDCYYNMHSILGEEGEDVVKIERIVPMYSYSKDLLAYERLIRDISLYRLTPGQPRLEELFDYISENCDPETLRELFLNLSPFYKEGHKP